MDWLGLFVPAKTSPEAIAKLATAARSAVKDPVLIEALDKLGFETVDMPTADFARRIAQETAFWAPIVKASGFTAED